MLKPCYLTLSNPITNDWITIFSDKYILNIHHLQTQFQELEIYLYKQRQTKSTAFLELMFYGDDDIKQETKLINK